MSVHIPNNIRDVGLLSDWSTEALESGHSWMNGMLINASNSIPGERMKTVLTGKTTDEYMQNEEPELAEMVERIATKGVEKKERRFKTTMKRVKARLKDIQSVLADLPANSEERLRTVKERLTKLKTERRASERQSRKKIKTDTDT